MRVILCAHYACVCAKDWAGAGAIYAICAGTCGKLLTIGYALLQQPFQENILFLNEIKFEDMPMLSYSQICVYFWSFNFCEKFGVGLNWNELNYTESFRQTHDPYETCQDEEIWFQ